MAAGARAAGQDRRGPQALRAEREPAQPLLRLRGAPLDHGGAREGRRDPGAQGRPRPGREADRREPQVEPELGARAGPRRPPWRSCAARRCWPRPSSLESPWNGPATSRPSTGSSCSRPSTTPGSRWARCPTRKRSSRTSWRGSSACSTPRAATWRPSARGAPAAPRRASGSRKRPAEAVVAVGRVPARGPRLRGRGRRGAKFKLLGKPVPRRRRRADLGRRTADRRARPRRQGGPARRIGRVRRGGPPVPRLARGPLRHGDREPPPPRAADARARAARGGEPPPARRDRAVGGGPALRRRLAGGAPRARPRRRASRRRRSRSS